MSVQTANRRCLADTYWVFRDTIGTGRALLCCRFSLKLNGRVLSIQLQDRRAQWAVLLLADHRAVETWLRQPVTNFIYTNKVCELITHLKRFEDTQSLVEDFGYIADMLG